MPPTVLPTPVGKWKKWLLDAAKNIAVGLIQSLDYYEQINLVTEQPPAEWRRVSMLFRDPLDADAANIAATTFDFVNITNGSVDNTWNDDDYLAIEGALITLWGALGAHIDTRCQMFETRYYRMLFNPLPDPSQPLSDDKPFAPSGGPERVFSHVIAGTGVGHLPPQCSITTTERTNFPRHWGRNYWPWPASSTVGTDGRMLSAVTNTFATALETAYDSLQGQEFFPVVPVTRVRSGNISVPARGLLSVSAVQVDNVFDVQRRRRSHTATQKLIRPIG